MNNLTLLEYKRQTEASRDNRMKWWREASVTKILKSQ